MFLCRSLKLDNMCLCLMLQEIAISFWLSDARLIRLLISFENREKSGGRRHGGLWPSGFQLFGAVVLSNFFVVLHVLPNLI